jgi:hypothetical protein
MAPSAGRESTVHCKPDPQLRSPALRCRLSGGPDSLKEIPIKPFEAKTIVRDQIVIVTTGRAAVLIQSFLDFVTTQRRQLCFLASVVLFVASLSRYPLSFDPNASLRLIGASLRWAPSRLLREGLEKTSAWISKQVEQVQA